MSFSGLTRESRHPYPRTPLWIPAFAGMTVWEFWILASALSTELDSLE